MEFQKNSGNFSFGFGSTKVAGVGKIADSAETKPTKKQILRKAVNVGTQIAVLAVIRKVIKNKE